MRLTLLLRTDTILMGPITTSSQNKPTDQVLSPTPRSITLTLKRSGRVLRKIEASSASFDRYWSLPSQVSDSNNNQVAAINVSSNIFWNHKIINFSLKQVKRKVGEVLHIIRPLVHLTSLGLFGEKSWKPFFISLAVDCSSMSLHGSLSLMTAEEKQEMLRRRIAMLAYILRSPFYDLKSKTMIVSTLQFSRDNIPLLGSVAKALLNYLDEYQQVYSYTWLN